jgi:hypothetical protein
MFEKFDVYAHFNNDCLAVGNADLGRADHQALTTAFGHEAS